MHPVHRLVDLSDRRRVFAAGDIHGEYEELEAALEIEGFDPERDALVLVGDLADRGPDSPAALDWARRPWVHRCLGNHDVAPRLVLSGRLARHDFSEWGGDWALALPDAELRRAAAILEDAPVALTVLTPGGRRVGLIHADCMGDWDEHIRALEEDSIRARSAKDLSLWSRETIDALMAAQKEGRPLDPELATVSGIDHVFSGHTPIGRPFTLGNRSWIDTGCCFGGDLTVVDVDAWIEAEG